MRSASTRSSCATTFLQPRCRKFRFPHSTPFLLSRRYARNGGRVWRICPGSMCRQMEISDVMPHASRAIAATSPSLDRSIGIVVCIPSFRRPQHLRRTLDSLADQHTERRFAAVIVENDASACASVPVAVEFLQAGKFPGLCVVEPRQGNCHAINAAFDTALATFAAGPVFLISDYNEIPSPDWLELMVSAAETTGADVVGGPVLPNFDDALK